MSTGRVTAVEAYTDMMRERGQRGRHAREPGAKLDAGKMRASLLLDFARALEAVGDVCTFGAEKYSRGGWLEVPDGPRRYTDALLRHLLAEGQGESHDPESLIRHSAHVAWNALARLELALREAGEARKPPPAEPARVWSDLMNQADPS